jgi:hypothetical protein
VTDNPTAAMTPELLAADIMAAMRRARFPKEYAEEAHDEFEALVLTPMLRAAMQSAQPSAPLVGNKRILALTEAMEKMREALVETRPYVEQAGYRHHDVSELLANIDDALTKEKGNSRADPPRKSRPLPEGLEGDQFSHPL